MLHNLCSKKTSHHQEFDHRIKEVFDKVDNARSSVPNNRQVMTVHRGELRQKSRRPSLTYCESDCDAHQVVK